MTKNTSREGARHSIRVGRGEASWSISLRAMSSLRSKRRFLPSLRQSPLLTYDTFLLDEVTSGDASTMQGYSRDPKWPTTINSSITWILIVIPKFPVS
jgi:hypothetical protein